MTDGSIPDDQTRKGVLRRELFIADKDTVDVARYFIKFLVIGEINESLSLHASTAF